MKASIEKLRRLTSHSHKVDGKDKGETVATTQIDELARAGKDMQDMRDCYDRLLAAAAATANSAYEFSESLGEMGSCLEQIAPHNDEESSRILFMLGKVQSELQRLLDTYRSHIFKTITSPSEALLKDLRTVEDMKQQCDEKRTVFEMSLVKDKGRPKSSKGERHIPPESRPAYSEFHDEATMCIFRLKSLKEGQARSLLTQAVRHHTAQMHLFHTGLKSLEAVERRVKVAALNQHIDCDLSVHGNEVEASEDDDDGDGRYMNREGELSFDYRKNEQKVEAASLSTPGGSVKVDDTDLSFPRPSAIRPAAVYADHREEYPVSTRDKYLSSHSAPLFPEKKPDVSERLRPANPSSNAYVLPTPNESRYPKPASQALNPRPVNHSAGNIWHSSPLEPIKSGKDAENNNLYGRVPRPATTDTHHHQQLQAAGRHAFSGPLKPSSTKPITTADSYSGMFCPLPTPPVLQPHPLPSSSPRVSPTASPPPGSSPRLNELHELPRPPGHFPPPPRRAKSPSLVGHSAPLTAWNQERNTVTVAAPSATNIVASRLPIPPLVIPRSYSIPSRNQRAVSQRPVERSDGSVAVASPPLTPMSLSRPLPQATGVAQTSQIRGVGKLIER
ncbi:uncharacterized protein At2g33490 isoform X1 [Capsella rubella]|uniref:uncharacterized protein At2g33490 isoform X1 n=1 Tax=Capsella rubella TaxID=81985 RepID=UPI000CD4DA9D|nr:uncharacterized protein At2g33490 isoform X1 [Capsella rubella]